MSDISNDIEPNPLPNIPADPRPIIVPEILEPKTIEERMARVEHMAETTNSRLEEMQKALEEVPDILTKAFENYDKTLRASLGQGGGSPNMISEVLGIVKTVVAGGPQQQTDEITNLSRELILMNMRGMQKEWAKKLGLSTHVVVTE